jgi:hypothetical protein
MAITPARFLEIVKSRNLSVVSIRKSDGSTRWTVKTQEGTRATGANTHFSSPEEAVERADFHLGESEFRNKEREFGKIINILEKGVFYIKSKEVGEGKLKVYDAFRVDDDSLIVENRTSFVQAVLDADRE